MSEKKEYEKIQEQLGTAIRNVCSSSFGDLSSSFLCRSVGTLNLPKPIVVGEDTTVGKVIKVLQENRIGSVVVVNEQGKVSGIFTERDCVRKVLGAPVEILNSSITTLMSRDPVTQPADTTIAYALNLMSHGGFRHIPVVDGDGAPIGIVSVKDIVDYLVQTMTEDLLGLEVEE